DKVVEISGLGRDGRQRDRRDAPRRQSCRVDVSPRTAGRPVRKVPTTGTEAGSEWCAHCSADAVEHDVKRPATAEDDVELIRPVVVAVVDQEVGAEAAGVGQLALVAGECDDHGPGMTGELDE